MPIYHDVAQYSEAYDRLKLGIPTRVRRERTTSNGRAELHRR
jgi:hypothetical protein